MTRTTFSALALLGLGLCIAGCDTTESNRQDSDLKEAMSAHNAAMWDYQCAKLFGDDEEEELCRQKAELTRQKLISAQASARDGAEYVPRDSGG